MGNRQPQIRHSFQNQFDIINSVSGLYRLQHRITKQLFIARQLKCDDKREAFQVQCIINQKLKNPSPYLIKLIGDFNDYQPVYCSQDNKYYVLYREISKLLYDQMNQRSLLRKPFHLQQIDVVINRVAKAIQYVYNIYHHHGLISPHYITWPYRPSQSIQLVDQWLIPSHIRQSKLNIYVPRDKQAVDQKLLMMTNDLYNLGVVARQMSNISNGQLLHYSQPGYNQLMQKIQILLSPIPIQRTRIFGLLTNAPDSISYQANIPTVHQYEQPVLNQQNNYQQTILTQPVMNAPKVIEQPIPIGSFHQKSSSLQKDIAQQGQPVQHNNYRISQINQQVSHNRNLTPPQNHNISIPKNNTKNVPLPNLNRSVSRNKVHVSPVNTNQNNNAIVPAPAPQPPLNLNFSSGMFNQAQITTPSNINKYNFSIPPAHQKIPVNPNINNVNLQVAQHGPKPSFNINLNLNLNSKNSNISTNMNTRASQMSNIAPSTQIKNVINIGHNQNRLVPQNMISLEKTGRSRSTANINSNNNTIVAPINPLKKSNLNPTPVNINFVNSASVAEPNNSNLVNSSSVPLLNVNLGHVNFPVNQVNPAHTNMITSINNPTINYNGQGYGVSASGLTFSFGQNSSQNTFSFKGLSNSNSGEQALFTPPDFFNKIKQSSIIKQQHSSSLNRVDPVAIMQKPANTTKKSAIFVQQQINNIPVKIANPMHILQNSLANPTNKFQNNVVTHSFNNQMVNSSHDKHQHNFQPIIIENTKKSQTLKKSYIKDSSHNDSQVVIAKQDNLEGKKSQIRSQALGQVVSRNYQQNEQEKEKEKQSETQKQPISTATIAKNTEQDMNSQINQMMERQKQRNREMQKKNNQLFKSAQIPDNQYQFAKIQRSHIMQPFPNIPAIKSIDQTSQQFYEKISLSASSTKFDTNISTNYGNNYTGYTNYDMPYTNNYTKNYSGNYGTNYSNNYGTTYEMGFNKQYKDPFPGISKTDNYSTDTYNYKYEPINFSSESNKYKYDSLDYSSDSYTNSNKYKKYDGHGLTDYNYKLDDKDVQNQVSSKIDQNYIKDKPYAYSFNNSFQMGNTHNTNNLTHTYNQVNNMNSHPNSYTNSHPNSMQNSNANVSYAQIKNEYNKIKNNQDSANVRVKDENSDVQNHNLREDTHKSGNINIVIHRSPSRTQSEEDYQKQFFNRYSQNLHSQSTSNNNNNKNQNVAYEQDFNAYNNTIVNQKQTKQQDNPELVRSTPSKQQTNKSNQPFSTIPQVSQRSVSARSDDQRDYIIQQYENGSRYQGYKSNGMRNGKGRFFYQEGSFYDGQWKNNNMHGYGKLYYSNNKLAYEGQWFIDQFHGRGRVFNDEPAPVQGFFDYTNFQNLDEKWKHYEGDLVCDSKQGEGKLVLSNDEYYQGQFRNDKVEGKGKFVTKNGQVIYGIWDDSKLVMRLQN